MADIKPAKAGDLISEKARAKLRAAMGGDRVPLAAIPTKVEPKAEGAAGQWFCIDCGDLPQNQMYAHQHAAKRGKHRLAWRSFVTGKIEAP